MLLAIICNSLPPYRIHFHRRIARECPEITLHTLVTHNDSRWPNRMIAEINTTMFGDSEVLGDHKIKAFQRDYRMGGRIIDYLKKHAIEAVIINGYNDLGRLRVFRWCKKNNLRAYLWSDSNIHGDRATGLKKKIKRVIVSRVVKACTGVLVCGQYGRQYYEQYGAKPKQIGYIPYEPDYSLIESITTHEIEQAVNKHRLNGPGPRVLFCGRLIDAKRPDLVIQAFNMKATSNPEASLVMVGHGPLEEDLLAMVDPSLANRVHWTGFINDEREMAAIFHACDIMILPSQYEPWALVVNEAAAAGMAIIASDVVGAAPELVIPGVNGERVPPNNLEKLADSLDKLLSQPSVLQAYRAGSREALNTWREKADPVAGIRALSTPA